MGTVMIGPYAARRSSVLPPEPPHLAALVRLVKLVLPRLQRERELALVDLRQQAHHPALRQLSQILKQGCDHDESTGSLARRCGVSVSRLQHLCREEIGMTLGELRDRSLVRRAESQLLRQDQAIGVIARSLGFADQRYFASWFRRLTGCSPSQWRAEQVAREDV